MLSSSPTYLIYARLQAAVHVKMKQNDCREALNSLSRKRMYLKALFPAPTPPFKQIQSPASLCSAIKAESSAVACSEVAIKEDDLL